MTHPQGPHTPNTTFSNFSSIIEFHCLLSKLFGKSGIRESTANKYWMIGSGNNRWFSQIGSDCVSSKHCLCEGPCFNAFSRRVTSHTQPYYLVTHHHMIAGTLRIVEVVSSQGNKDICMCMHVYHIISSSSTTTTFVPMNLFKLWRSVGEHLHQFQQTLIHSWPPIQYWPCNWWFNSLTCHKCTAQHGC